MDGDVSVPEPSHGVNATLSVTFGAGAAGISRVGRAGGAAPPVALGLNDAQAAAVVDALLRSRVRHDAVIGHRQGVEVAV